MPSGPPQMGTCFFRRRLTCRCSYVLSRDKFLDKVTEELSKQEWAKDGDAVKGCFDYAAYAAALAEQQGYQATEDGLNYIA